MISELGSFDRFSVIVLMSGWLNRVCAFPEYTGNLAENVLLTTAAHALKR